MPSSIAFLTAQPGSLSCLQSENLHFDAISSISEKDLSTSPVISWSSLIPGVSITTPPWGNASNSLCVVVCLPLSSFLNPLVRRTSSSISLLIRVDFPTPDDPINATVFSLVI